MKTKLKHSEELSEFSKKYGITSDFKTFLNDEFITQRGKLTVKFPQAIKAKMFDSELYKLLKSCSESSAMRFTSTEQMMKHKDTYHKDIVLTKQLSTLFSRRYKDRIFKQFFQKSFFDMIAKEVSFEDNRLRVSFESAQATKLTDFKTLLGTSFKWVKFAQ